MLLVRTPFRVSFIGGGSDFYNYYKNSPGAVISTTINKYMYIAINKKFDGKIRINYSQTEEIERRSDIKHPLVRESLKLFNINSGIEISSQADIPSNGSGLGSSSAYTSGLINGLSTYLGKSLSKMDIANHTCDIEINRCGEPIGKQDQFSVTFGGFNLFEFNCDDTVCVNPINNADGIRKLEESLLIFYTGQNRVASSILLEQNNNLNESQYKAYVKNIVELVYAFKASLEKSDIKNCGALINESWFYKKKLSENVSNDSIDHAHKVAMANGAYGGKILGAGNGGFIMFLANKSDHKKITKALDFFRPYNFLFDSSGTTVVYNDNKL